MSPAKQGQLIRRIWVFSLVFLIAAGVVVLFLPPISLAQRFLYLDYEAIGPDNRTLYADDGAQITFVPVEAVHSAWVKFDILSDDEFWQETPDNTLSTAAENLSPNLTIRSPLYHIEYSGDPPTGVVLTAPIPNTEKPNYTLDLYAWNGASWEWQPSRQVSMKDVIEAHLNFLPDTVAIMQTNSSAPKIALTADLDAGLPDDIEDSLAEINPRGLVVERNGQITGNLGKVLQKFQEADIAIMPTLTNQNEAGGIDANPVNILLVDSQVRKQHIRAIVDLVQRNGYQGIDLDYRVNPNLRHEYTAFLTELRQALPEDKQLSVRVELPRQMSTGAWDTGAYDWQAIGRLANVIKVPTLPDPKTYAPGGQMDAMLEWAVGQVNRYKVQLVFKANSTERVDDNTRDISLRQALEQIGGVTLVNAPDVINPGQNINLTLTGPQPSTGVQVDDTSGTYWFGYLDEDNQHHTIYLENPARLAQTLHLVTQYNLQGVAVQNLPGPETNGQIWPVVRNFFNSNPAPPAVDREYSVAWRVHKQDGRLVTEKTTDLSHPDFQWTAPNEGGVFEIAASIASGQNSSPLSQEKVVVLVATPTPTPSPTPVPTSTPTLTATPRPTPTPLPTPTPKPIQPAPVPQQTGPVPPAVAPVNVAFGYGIQADPQGDTGANIGHIKTLGFNWIKFQMAWKDVESAPGNYSWVNWDQLIDAYHANGIQILLSIPKAPDWTRPFDDDKSVEGPPQDPNLYAEFVAKVAGRYQGKVQAIEIWNEQNLWYEAGGLGRINAANYVQLLQLSYRAIKAVNPQMIVVSGALTPAGNVGEAAVDDIDYLHQMYANGAKGFFDALGAHPSGYNCPAQGDWRSVTDSTAINFRGPFANRHHSWCFRGTMEGYREVMVANGDGHKAIIPTEFGWAVSGNPKPGYEYARDNTPEEQAQWIVEAYQMGKAWGWVGPMFLWNLDYGVTAPNTELADFGIIDKPAYDALVNMPK